MAFRSMRLSVLMPMAFAALASTRFLAACSSDGAAPLSDAAVTADTSLPDSAPSSDDALAADALVDANTTADATELADASEDASAPADALSDTATPATAAPRYEGRWGGIALGTPTAANAGAAVVVAFVGPELSIELEDLATDMVDVQVDDGAPVAMLLQPGVQVLQVASGLSNARHEVRITRRNESANGSALIIRHYLLGASVMAAPTPATGRLVQFIGDSNSVGLGTVPSGDCINAIWTAENHSLAFPALVARAFHAEEDLVARSGIGLWRNIDVNNPDVSPVVYDRTSLLLPLPAAGQPDPWGQRWDAASHHPDFVYIMLGQNDFEYSPSEQPPTEAQMRAAMRDYTAKIRGLHPHARIVVGLSPNVQDTPPWFTRPILRQAYQAAVADRNGAGDAAIRFFEPTPIADAQRASDLSACWSHFSAAYHARLADEIKALVSQETGWTP